MEVTLPSIALVPGPVLRASSPKRYLFVRSLNRDKLNTGALIHSCSVGMRCFFGLNYLEIMI